VNKAAAAATQTISAATLQYSDRETFEVTVTGANGEAPAAGANFKIGTQIMNGATPVPFVNQGGGMWKATLANQQLLETSPAGQLKPTGTSKFITVTYASPSLNYTLAAPTMKALLITPENARVAYSGLTTVRTAGGGSTATISLKATVKDITNTPEAAGDTAPGDVRLAQVMFINRATGATIATVNVAIDPADPNGGIATYDWNVDIGANPSQTFTVGFNVITYYTRNSTTDNALITVSK
jgi:hypothetical protein